MWTREVIATLINQELTKHQVFCSNTVRQVLFPFYRWGDQGSEKVSNLARVTQLVSNRARFKGRSFDSKAHGLHHHQGGLLAWWPFLPHVAPSRPMSDATIHSPSSITHYILTPAFFLPFKLTSFLWNNQLPPGVSPLISEQHLALLQVRGNAGSMETRPRLITQIPITEPSL